MNRLLLAAIFLFLPFCSQAQDKASGLTQGSQIKSGCEYDYPPYCVVGEDGTVDGFSVELLRETLKVMGRDVNFKTAVWSELKNDLKEGRLQVLPLVGRTPEREADYDFTFPYLSMHGVIVVRDDNKGIHSKEDLKGRRVSVLKGDNAEEYLRRSNLGAVIVTTSSFDQALRDLSAGKSDAVLIQQLLFFNLLRQNQLQNLKVVGHPLDDFVQNFCFAVKSGDKKMLALLNEGLSIVIANGTFRRLNDKWFSSLASIGREKGVIIVGGDSDYPPYEFLNAKGEPSGYNIDLTRAIAEQIGLKVEFRLQAWSRTIAELKSGKIDIVPGMFYSAARAADFNFSQAHTVVNHCIVVRKGEKEFFSVKDLAGKSILVMDRDIMHDFVINYGVGDDVIPVATQEDALRLLSQGKGDCALVARVPALFFIEKNGWQNLHVLDMSLLPSEYCLATSKDKTTLLSQFSEGLAALKKTGKYRQIYSKWLGVYEENSQWKIFRVAAIIIAVISVLLLFSLLLSRSLKKQVEKMTADLRIANERFRLAADSADIGVWDWDIPKNYLLWDERMCRLYACTSKAFDNVYDAWISRLHPEDIEKINREIKMALDGTKDYNTEFRIVLPGGDIHFIRAFGKVIRDEKNGRPLRMTGINYDISGRKHTEEALKEAKEYAENLIQTANAMVIVLDKKGEIQVFNKSAEEITGYTKDDLKDKNWFETIVPRARYPKVWEEFERLTTGGFPKNFENPILTKEGEERYIIWQNTYIMSHGQIVGTISFGIDITERKLAEESLRLSREKLEQNNRMLEEALHNARELAIQAESANKAKSEFLANMSHEIRTPLNAVIGFGELLQDSELNPKQREYVSIITSRGSDLLSIIRDILDLSKLEAEMIDLTEEPFDLPETLGSAMNTVKFTADQKKLETILHIEPDVPPILKGDSLRLKQILLNLLGNAVKFTDHGSVRLDVSKLSSSAEGEPSYVRFAVTDTGIGIPRDKHSVIFDPFVQADGSHTRKYGGTGLGLSICKRLAAKMGGSLSLQSEPGKGSSFIFLMPEKPASIETGMDTDTFCATVRMDGGYRILVVEDDPSSLQLLRELLTSHGCEVVAAESGRAAMEAVKSGFLDLIIMDIQMPELNGLDASTAIRQLEAAGKLPQKDAASPRKRIPIIAFSAFATVSDKERCLAAGMDDFLSKPARKKQVIDTISRWLHLSV